MRRAGQHRVLIAPAFGGRAHPHGHLPAGGELEGVGEQILENLLQALGVGAESAGQGWVELNAEAQVFGLGDVPEVALDRLAHHCERHILDIHRHGARLDLGEVQGVIDEREQVRAGGMDVLGKLDLFGSEVAGLVLGHLLAQDEDGVKRSAQLVRHVGQELGFVFGGQGQLGGLFFKSAARQLDFLVLTFDFDVLLGELAGLGGQLLVGLLELLLLSLQLRGKLLGLFEQALGTHGGLDGVEHHPDGLGELFEERQVRRRERTQGSQLNDGLGLALEERREDHDAARLSLAEA